MCWIVQCKSAASWELKSSECRATNSRRFRCVIMNIINGQWAFAFSIRPSTDTLRPFGRFDLKLSHLFWTIPPALLSTRSGWITNIKQTFLFYHLKWEKNACVIFFFWYFKYCFFPVVIATGAIADEKIHIMFITSKLVIRWFHRAAAAAPAAKKQQL